MNRIDGTNPLITSRTMGGHAAGGIDGAGDGDHSKADGVGGKQDAVVLSFRGRTMSEVSQAVSEASEVRAEKVAALKAAIANGSYQSNARDIAVRLYNTGVFGG